MVNQSFSFETVEKTEINGVEHVFYTRTYQMLSFFSIGFLAKAFMVYTNALYLLPTFFRSKKFKSYFWKALALIAITALGEYLLNVLSYWLFEDRSLEYFYSMWYLNVLFYISFFGISIAYAMSKNWQKNERLKQHLIREKLSTELSFLKSQINPHFLFNTLNNLFALAERKNNPELSKGIADLSYLMRYMLYDCKADFVPLEKEIRFLKSLMEMYQLRIAKEDDVAIALNIKGEILGKKIAPLLLVPFVENAFKYGINFRQTSFIKIDIIVEEYRLFFKTTNTCFKNIKNVHRQHSGIGLENVQRRLELIYPNAYQLHYGERGKLFIVELELIDLNKK